MSEKIHRIAVIAGDGIGKEVVPAAQSVIEATGRAFGFRCEWSAFDWSCEVYADTGSMTGGVSIEALAEFDAVFLPELQTLRVDASNSDVAKMTLYVMCSRARTYLELMVSDEKGEAAIWEYLPKKTDDVLTFSSRG